VVNGKKVEVVRLSHNLSLWSTSQVASRKSQLVAGPYLFRAGDPVTGVKEYLQE